MALVEGSVVIDRPVEEVFDFVADGCHEPQYHPEMRRVDKLTEGPVGTGTRFRAEIAGRGRPVTMTTEFIGVERPRRIDETSSWRGWSSSGHLSFDPVPAGTLMSWSWDVRPKGVMRTMGPLVRSIGRRQERRIWTALKGLLEEHRERW